MPKSICLRLAVFTSTAPVLLFCSYAYLECANEKTAYEMSEKYKDAEINGEKLFVIQAISEKKDNFGEWSRNVALVVNKFKEI